jgi:hypothetical protein
MISPSDVLSQLQALGLDIMSLSDAPSQKSKLDFRMLEFLIGAMADSDERAKDVIVRLLGSPKGGCAAAEALMREFRLEFNETRKWIIADSVALTRCTQSILDDLFAAIVDESNGKAREMLVVALGRSHDEKVEPFLIHLTQDDMLRGYAAKALADHPTPLARQALAAMTNDPVGWIRRAAKTSLAKVERDLE